MKKILKRIVISLSLVACVVSAFPFIKSLGVSEKAKSASLVLIDAPKLEAGKVETILVEGHPLFILMPDVNQKYAIQSLDAHVWDSISNAYFPELEAYVYWGMSTRMGCNLMHKPPEESKPIRWNKDAKWLGGYWDPLCEVSYDYAGRSIKDYGYTYNGYPAKFSNLKTPRVFVKQPNNKYLVSIWQR